MRDIAWQLQYHACCLLAQDSSPAPRQHRTQQQQQWLLANGRHEDMQSAAAAIARVAAALGPREEHLVAALTDATAILDEEVHACMHIGSVGQSSSGHGSPIQPDAAGSGGSAVASGGGVYHLDGASGACAADRTRDLIEISMSGSCVQRHVLPTTRRHHPALRRADHGQIAGVAAAARAPAAREPEGHRRWRPRSRAGTRLLLPPR